MQLVPVPMFPGKKKKRKKQLLRQNILQLTSFLSADICFTTKMKSKRQTLEYLREIDDSIFISKGEEDHHYFL